MRRSEATDEIISHHYFFYFLLEESELNFSNHFAEFQHSYPLRIEDRFFLSDFDGGATFLVTDLIVSARYFDTDVLQGRPMEGETIDDYRGKMVILWVRRLDGSV